LNVVYCLVNHRAKLWFKFTEYLINDRKLEGILTIVSMVIFVEARLMAQYFTLKITTILLLYSNFLDRNDFHRTSFGSQFGFFQNVVISRFEGVETFVVNRFQEDGFTVFFRHPVMRRIQFDAIVATDAFFSLKGDDDHWLEMNFKIG